MKLVTTGFKLRSITEEQAGKLVGPYPVEVVRGRCGSNDNIHWFQVLEMGTPTVVMTTAYRNLGYYGVTVLQPGDCTVFDQFWNETGVEHLAHIGVLRDHWSPIFKAKQVLNTFWQ